MIGLPQMEPNGKMGTAMDLVTTRMEQTVTSSLMTHCVGRILTVMDTRIRRVMMPSSTTQPSGMTQMGTVTETTKMEPTPTYSRITTANGTMLMETGWGTTLTISSTTEVSP